MVALLEIIVFLVGLLIDRAAKILTMVYLQPTGVGTSVEAIPGILSFTYVENRGAAHGILQGQVWFFIPVTIIVPTSIFPVIYLLKGKFKHLPSSFTIRSTPLSIGIISIYPSTILCKVPNVFSILLSSILFLQISFDFQLLLQVLFDYQILCYNV